MLELRNHLPDWRLQVESSSFITERKGDVTEGSQATVFTRTGIDVVVKVPKHPIFLENYISAGRVVPASIVPFEVVENLSLRVDHRAANFSKAIVQKKVDIVHPLIVAAARSRDAALVERLIVAATGADRKMFGEGVFVSDPGFSNQGLDKDGSVKFTDVGSARTKFPNNMDYSNVALCRALTHYTAYYMIRSICWGMKTSSGISFNDLYAKVVGFEPRTIPSASSTREILRNRFAPQVSLALAKAGDEEFKRFASNGAPFDLYTEFLQNLPKSLLWKQ